LDIQDLHKYLEKMDAESKANHKESQYPIAKHVDRIQFLLKAVKWVGVPTIIAGLIYLAKTLAS